MRDYLEAKHVLAVSSCTAALHLSLVALGVGPGDEVITTSITWPSTANVIVHCGATPVFADVRDDTLNIDPDRVRELVERAHEGDRPGRPLRPAGRPRRAASRSACRSSRTPRTPPSRATAAARSASIADLTCFSLYATKNIAAGEGGLHRDEPRRSRGGARRPARDAPRARLALRHRGARATRRTSATCSRRSRSCSSTRSTGTARSAAGTSRSTTRGSPELDGIEAVARDPRDVHANHLYVVRVTLRRPRRGAARADRREHRHVDPLPAGAPAERVPRPARAAPARPARDRARRRRGALAAALARALGRRRPRCGRGAPPRARAPRLMKRWLRVVGDARRHGARGHLHRPQDRPRQDAGHPRLGERPVGDRVSAFLTLVTVPPMAWRWQQLLAVARRPRARAVADAHVLRLLRRRPGPADRRSAATRRGSIETVRRHPGDGHADHGLGAARARARRRRHAAARRRRLPARDRALPDRRRTSGSR